MIWLIVLGAAALFGAFGAALAVSSKRKYAAQNVVVAGVKSVAPKSWAGSHEPAAKLHRRLGEAVTAARANPRLVELGLAEKTAIIEKEALAIDDRIVAAGSLPERVRGDAVAKLEGAVVALEDAVASLVTSVSVDDSAALHERAVDESVLKLQALEAARKEVEQIDMSIAGTAPTPSLEPDPAPAPTTSPVQSPKPTAE